MTSVTIILRGRGIWAVLTALLMLAACQPRLERTGAARQTDSASPAGSTSGATAAKKMTSDPGIFWNVHMGEQAPVNLDDFPIQKGRVILLKERYFDDVYPEVRGTGKNAKVDAGGVPQVVAFDEKQRTRYMNRFEEVITNKVPEGYTGYVVFELEAWTPWMPSKESSRTVEYQKALDEACLRAVDCKNVAPGRVAEVARERWKKAARNLMVGPLELGRELRPEAKFGYYGYPRRVRGADDRASMQSLHDRWGWIFEASGALFPSLYMSMPTPSAQLPGATMSDAQVRAYITETVAEARRLAGDKPVVPYTWPRYKESRDHPAAGHLLSPRDLELEMQLPLEAGADGIIIWDTARRKEERNELQAYVNRILGPLAHRIRARATRQ